MDMSEDKTSRKKRTSKRDRTKKLLDTIQGMTLEQVEELKRRM